MAGLSKEQWEQVRAEWEGSPQQGLAWLTKRAGGSWEVGEETLRRRRMKEGWQKRANLAVVIERAQLAADAAAAQAEAGGSAPDEKKGLDAADLAEKRAVELRAKLIERHRAEWNVPRALSAEAVKTRDFNLSKLAKITSETLKLIQDGERKAWGMDAAGETAQPGSQGTTVIVERTKGTAK